jgi:predicted anti-sigma-YlaC factor YlaD
MDCAEIRDAFRRGAVPLSAEARAHLAECPHCRELLESDAALGRTLASAAALPAPFPTDFLDELEARVASETGVRAWLRSRPTKLRFLIALLSVLFAVGVGGVLNLRHDFSGYPRARLLVLLLVYSAGILIALGKELFLSAWRGAFADHLLFVVAALGLPLLVAFVPPTEASRAFGPEGALNCFVFGALLTLPTAALLWAFDRDERLSLRTVCLSAAALGLSANLLLELHCGNGNPAHVLLGHVSVGVAWLIAWAFARRLTSTA